MEFINLPNGRRKVIFESYVFVKQKNLAAGRISWECEKRRNAGSCRAKIKTFNDVFEGRTNEHTCAILPNSDRAEALKARNAMTLHAQTSDDTTNNIIGANVQNLTEAGRVQLLSLETIRRGIRHLHPWIQNLLYPLNIP